MTVVPTDPTNLTHRIQARDGVAVVVYTKNGCFGCTKSKEKLDEADIVYTEVNVEEDATAYHYVTEVLGYRQMPVLYVSTIDGDRHWSGLQPQKIREEITHRADAA
ncbi:thioredoxin [Arthrobacter phage Sakai]|jgi:glutaredoxin-like protein NrdH|nr:thioredoxin [Arthrobacter phage Gorpy]UVK62018.1 thioredoxin [Arthrobacter phage Sakai]